MYADVLQGMLQVIAEAGGCTGACELVGGARGEDAAAGVDGEALEEGGRQGRARARLLTKTPVTSGHRVPGFRILGQLSAIQG